MKYRMKMNGAWVPVEMEPVDDPAPAPDPKPTPTPTPTPAPAPGGESITMWPVHSGDNALMPYVSQGLILPRGNGGEWSLTSLSGTLPMAMEVRTRWPDGSPRAVQIHTERTPLNLPLKLVEVDANPLPLSIVTNAEQPLVVAEIEGVGSKVCVGSGALGPLTMQSWSTTYPDGMIRIYIRVHNTDITNDVQSDGWRHAHNHLLRFLTVDVSAFVNTGEHKRAFVRHAASYAADDAPSSDAVELLPTEPDARFPLAVGHSIVRELVILPVTEWTELQPYIDEVDNPPRLWPDPIDCKKILDDHGWAGGCVLDLCAAKPMLDRREYVAPGAATWNTFGFNGSAPNQGGRHPEQHPSLNDWTHIGAADELTEQEVAAAWLMQATSLPGQGYDFDQLWLYFHGWTPQYHGVQVHSPDSYDVSAGYFLQQRDKGHACVQTLLDVAEASGAAIYYQGLLDMAELGRCYSTRDGTHTDGENGRHAQPNGKPISWCVRQDPDAPTRRLSGSGARYVAWPMWLQVVGAYVAGPDSDRPFERNAKILHGMLRNLSRDHPLGVPAMVVQDAGETGGYARKIDSPMREKSASAVEAHFQVDIVLRAMLAYLYMLEPSETITDTYLLDDIERIALAQYWTDYDLYAFGDYWTPAAEPQRAFPLHGAVWLPQWFRVRPDQYVREMIEICRDPQYQYDRQAFDVRALDDDAIATSGYRPPKPAWPDMTEPLPQSSGEYWERAQKWISEHKSA